MKAHVNHRFLYELPQNPEIQVDFNEDKSYQFLFKGKSASVEVLEYDLRTKSFELAIDGFVFQVRLQDNLDSLLQLILKKSELATGNQVVVAPIPGMIKNLNKDEGDSVVSGEAVLVLEAMKMENTIQAPVDGDKIEYHVRAGERIGKGQPIFTIVQHSSGI